MKPQFIALYHRHVAMAFDRQMRLNEFLNEQASGGGWEYTTSKSMLTFGTSVRFEAHDLGSYAAPDSSWLWGWNNPHLALTEANSQLKNAVQQLGTEIGVPELCAEEQFSVKGLIGERLREYAADVFSMVLSRELGYDAYYKIPIEHGNATVLIRDHRLQFGEKLPLARIATNFPRTISAMPVTNHREAFTGYAEAYKLKLTSTPDSITATSGSDEQLVAMFDGKNRMVNLRTSSAAEMRQS